MFGLGRRKQEAAAPPAPVASAPVVQLYDLTFFPDGAIVGEGWVDASPGTMGPQQDGKIEGEFAIGGVPCKIDATLRGGNAILSMWADGKIVTSSLLLSSADAVWNAELTAMYLNSVRNTDLVLALTEGRMVFGEVERCAERPLLATLLMPAPSAELTDMLIEVQRNWAAAVLR